MRDRTFILPIPEKEEKEGKEEEISEIEKLAQQTLGGTLERLVKGRPVIRRYYNKVEVPTIINYSSSSYRYYINQSVVFPEDELEEIQQALLREILLEHGLPRSLTEEILQRVVKGECSLSDLLPEYWMGGIRLPLRERMEVEIVIIGASIVGLNMDPEYRGIFGAALYYAQREGIAPKEIVLPTTAYGFASVEKDALTELATKPIPSCSFARVVEELGQMPQEVVNAMQNYIRTHRQIFSPVGIKKY